MCGFVFVVVVVVVVCVAFILYLMFNILTETKKHFHCLFIYLLFNCPEQNRPDCLVTASNNKMINQGVRWARDGYFISFQESCLKTLWGKSHRQMPCACMCVSQCTVCDWQMCKRFSFWGKSHRFYEKLQITSVCEQQGAALLAEQGIVIKLHYPTMMKTVFLYR